MEVMERVRNCSRLKDTKGSGQVEATSSYKLDPVAVTELLGQLAKFR
jgi:hypothetical protein